MSDSRVELVELVSSVLCDETDSEDICSDDTGLDEVLDEVSMLEDVVSCTDSGFEDTVCEEIAEDDTLFDDVSFGLELTAPIPVITDWVCPF